MPAAVVAIRSWWDRTDQSEQVWRHPTFASRGGAVGPGVTGGARDTAASTRHPHASRETSVKSPDEARQVGGDEGHLLVFSGWASRNGNVRGRAAGMWAQRRSAQGVGRWWRWGCRGQDNRAGLRRIGHEPFGAAMWIAICPRAWWGRCRSGARGSYEPSGENAEVRADPTIGSKDGPCGPND